MASSDTPRKHFESFAQVELAIGRGVGDVEAGRGRPAEDVFADLRVRYASKKPQQEAS